MKVLLVALNASYMHTSLAIRSISNYVKNRFVQENISNIHVETAEFTINQPSSEILKGIWQSQADVVIFSTYIWNAGVIDKIIPDVKKVLDCLVGAGGPEYSYAAEIYFNKICTLDFIINGEGEETSFEFFKALNDRGFNKHSFDYKNFIDIKGLCFFDRESKKLMLTPNRDLINDLDQIPFSYPELLTDSFDPDHKIYYYESSRGCPYSCSYCLSSVDKRVRFKSIENVFRELKIFLDANVKLVKFVDRTYNLNPDRYIKIWDYIYTHHNQKTMFHFEIEAEYLSDEALEFLQKIPKGMMQFEIGVQSANADVLKAIHRSENVKILADNIRRIPRTIHQHLDLIAGLPYEDLCKFGKSYDFVMDLKPDALQLGFLKVLHGTQMEQFAKENNYKWQENAVYETFATPYMSFTDIMYLKDIETVTDALWNKHLMDKTMTYIFRKISPWFFVTEFCNFARIKNTFEAARKEVYWFNLIAEFFNQIKDLKNSKSQNELSSLDTAVLINLLRYDFVSYGKKGSFPDWYEHRYDKDKHRNLLEQNGMLHSTRLAFALTEFEVFDCDVLSAVPEANLGTYELLIKYPGSEEKYC